MVLEVPWNTLLADQLDWIWSSFTRPRFEGLGDEEYFWEPVAQCLSVRPAGESWTTQVGSGAWRYDDGEGQQVLDLEQPPVSTIAWRLAHIVVGIFGERTASHFGGPPIAYDSFAYAGSAAEALRQLDETYERWIAGVRGLDDEALAQPVGMAEGPYFADHPMSELVLHISREAIHHGAEVALLRDLWAHGVR